MPSHRIISDAEQEEFESGGGLKKETMEDRVREGKVFYKYVEDKADGVSIEDLIKTEEGRDRLNKIFSNYFLSMQVKSGDRPKKNYANKIRSHIKMFILDDKKFNILDPVQFPGAAKRWKSFMNKLAEEGRADTTHKEEIPSETLETIYELLWNVKEALEHRGEDDYVEKYLAKIPTEYHSELHRLLQYGAALVLNFYEVRRGSENLDKLKVSSFQVFVDKNYVFKYIKKVISESDKNHPGGTNVRCNGVIPFMEIQSGNNIMFNPGEYFEFYLSFLPLSSSKEHLDGGWLFPRPRKQGQSSLNIHSPGEMKLFEPNMKVGPRMLPGMLPSLCKAVGKERCTNHQIRTTAIIYMRRAGIPWLTIAKITGHQSVENLVKYYDLNLEAPGLAEVVGALAQGPSVASGGAPEKLTLESKQPERKKMKIDISGEDGDKTEDNEKSQSTISYPIPITGTSNIPGFSNLNSVPFSPGPAVYNPQYDAGEYHSNSNSVPFSPGPAMYNPQYSYPQYSYPQNCYSYPSNNLMLSSPQISQSPFNWPSPYYQPPPQFSHYQVPLQPLQVPQFQSQYYAAMSPCYQYPNMQYPYRAPNVYNIHNNNTLNWTP